MTPRIRRVSVVRKPAREPTVRLKGRRTAASPTVPARSATVPEPLRAAAWQPSGASPHAGASPRPTAGASPEARFAIPTSYPGNRLILMVKDPWWLYAYWDLEPQTERAARAQLLPNEVAGLRTILRVYDVTHRAFPGEPSQGVFDIALSGLANNWYLHTNGPNRSFVVELGLLTNAGRFLPMLRSNPVTAPRDGPSEVVEAEWAPPADEEAARRLAPVTAAGTGASPGGPWRQPGAPHLLAMSSWGLASPVRAQAHGVHCQIAADVVLHGRVEPHAAVTVQGQPVTLRKDGTFSLRRALPEGTQAVPIEVRSADHRSAQAITPILTFELTPSPSRSQLAPVGAAEPHPASPPTALP
jgi:hypothetical protein